MFSVSKPRDVSVAKKTVAALLLNISDLHDLASGTIPDQHCGSEYQGAALEHAIAVNKLEDNFSGEIRRAAVAITACSGKGWEENKTILGLWHQVALAVTNFSEHPTKKVASLIINDNGELLAFSANRVPEGVAKHGEYYVSGIRANFIVCSERIALARLLGITVEPEVRDFRQTQVQIQKLTDDIISAGHNNNSLRDSFFLTTAPSCEICAHAIAPFKPKGVITMGEVGADFTRARSMANAKNILENQGISIVYLPQPVLV